MKDREKYQVMNSIHFVHPIVDLHGIRRERLFADEASWRLRPESIQVGGAPGGVILKGAGQGPQQMLPIPMWEVIQCDLRTGHASVTLVPVELAHVRIAQRCVKDEEGRMQLVNHAAYDQLTKDAALARGVEVEH